LYELGFFFLEVEWGRFGVFSGPCVAGGEGGCGWACGFDGSSYSGTSRAPGITIIAMTTPIITPQAATGGAMMSPRRG